MGERHNRLLPPAEEMYLDTSGAASRALQPLDPGGNQAAPDLLISLMKKFIEALPLHAAPKRLLTVEEACHYLGVGRTEGYAQLRRHVRFIKHGRKILIPREELDHLVERAKRTGVLFV
jgi:excisionase family DNA binding protein